MASEYHDGATRARLDALTRMLDERENRNIERHNTIREILDRYMRFTDERFKLNNEWRGALDDQSKTFVSRHEYSVQHIAVVEKAEDASKRITRVESMTLGKSEGMGFVGTIIIGACTGIATVISIISLLINFGKH